MEYDCVVYLDVIFATELVMNYMVLAVYCRISRKKYGKFRRIAAVLVSTVFSVWGIAVSFRWNRWNPICSLALALGAVSLELLILQGRGRKLRQYVLEIPAMMLSAALLAGAVLLSGIPSRTGMLLGKALICVMVLTAGISVVHWRQRGIQEESLKTVWITIGRETYTVTAITDTGNNLYDRLSGLPVHIVEQKCILKEKQKEQLFEKDPERITFVPYSSLGNPHGLLMVVQVEQLLILDNGKKVELRDQKIGLTDQKLDRSGRWQMLLHPDLEACIHRKGGCI
ncbi:MAG: sigma-E processing peptidase SpoIIGA [Lachnospiraceae bacterium]|nr:sigma-E processing peptidase SpoIIGA [Lachnospiraceae bacterium]